MSLRTRIRNFLRDESGNAVLEAVIVMPALFWAFAATFVYWNAFRVDNLHVKATFTVSDMISREVAAVDMNYINGLHTVYRFVTVATEPSWLRVTSVQFIEGEDGAPDQHTVLWSRSTSPENAPQLTTETLVSVENRIPIMGNYDTILIVETWQSQPSSMGAIVPARTLHETSIVRPRFVSPLPIL